MTKIDLNWAREHIKGFAEMERKTIERKASEKAYRHTEPTTIH